MLPRTETQQAQSMGGTPLQRLLVAPDMVGAPAAQAAINYVGGTFRNEWVDDRNWDTMKTLPEIVGSGMLSQTALQNLAIGNVLTLFDFRGGSEQDRLEFGYLLQRFIMDGYIRGVDVYQYIKDTSQADGSRFVIGLMTEDEMKKLYNPGGAAALASSGGLGAIGLNNNANYTLFTDGYWRDAPETERFGMFYHEWGHQLGLPHAGDSGYNPSGEYGNFMGDTTPMANPPWGTEHVHFKPENGIKQFQMVGDQLIDSLFRDAGLGRGATMGTTLRRFDPASDDTTPPTSPPTGFPQIGGADQNNITQTTNTVYNIAPTQVNPASPNPIDLGSGGGSAGSPEDMDKTPVAGMLPSMPQLQSFAAGLGDIVNSAQPMINGLAGALIKRKGA